MRTHNFRAWHKERKQMSWDFGLFAEDITFYDRFNKHWCEQLDIDEHFWNLVIMQYLDIQDSTGKLLCFDDVVEIKYGSRIDKYFVIRQLNDYVELTQLVQELGASFKITGNIHEQPYLV